MKIRLAVSWEPAAPEAVPVILTTGLEVRAVDRFVRFARTHNPKFARYSATNEPKRGKPVLVLG
jgi:hypothetical protein